MSWAQSPGKPPWIADKMELGTVSLSSSAQGCNGASTLKVKVKGQKHPTTKRWIRFCLPFFCQASTAARTAWAADSTSALLDKAFSKPLRADWKSAPEVGKAKNSQFTPLMSKGQPETPECFEDFAFFRILCTFLPLDNKMKGSGEKLSLLSGDWFLGFSLSVKGFAGCASLHRLMLESQTFWTWKAKLPWTELFMTPNGIARPLGAFAKTLRSVRWWGCGIDIIFALPQIAWVLSFIDNLEVLLFQEEPSIFNHWAAHVISLLPWSPTAAPISPTSQRMPLCSQQSEVGQRWKPQHKRKVYLKTNHTKKAHKSHRPNGFTKNLAKSNVSSNFHCFEGVLCTSHAWGPHLWDLPCKYLT